MSNAKKIMKWFLGHSCHKILSANKNVYKTVKHMDNSNAIVLKKWQVISHIQDFYRKVRCLFWSAFSFTKC